MSSAPSPAARCPECGAELAAGQTQCWLCRGTPGGEAKSEPARLPRSAAAENASAQFSLSSLMLVMTLIAVCLGLLKVSPGYGILLIIVATPALVRTMVATTRRKQA